MQPRAFDEDAPNTLETKAAEGQPDSSKGKEPVTALEHYEMAVEREAVGNLGESLRLYRKAFRVCLPCAHPALTLPERSLRKC